MNGSVNGFLSLYIRPWVGQANCPDCSLSNPMNDGLDSSSPSDPEQDQVAEDVVILNCFYSLIFMLMEERK